jgi:hypothetical protein
MRMREAEVTFNGRQAYITFSVEDYGLAYCCYEGEYMDDFTKLTDQELEDISENYQEALMGVWK